MMKLLVIFIALCIIRVECELISGVFKNVLTKLIDFNEEQLDLFSKFKQLYSKVYKNDEDEAKRARNFIKNLIVIDSHNELDEGNWGCQGGNMQTAYNYIMKNGGINSYGSYPYRGRGNFSCRYDSNRSVGSISDYIDVESGNETALMYALNYAKGPITVAIDASDPKFQSYKSGIYDSDNCKNFPNHAVLLVGYGLDETFNPPAPYWLLKNSWGKDWGEAGFVRMAKDSGNLCSIAFDASYPVVNFDD